MVHTGRAFVAGIHPSRTWTSVSVESVRWNAYVHRLDPGLYTHPKEFLGSAVRIHVNSKRKILSTGNILPTGGSNPRPCIKQDSEPNTLRTSHSGPVFSFKWPRLSYREQFKVGDEEADRGNDGKTTSKSGLALNGISYYGKPRTARSGGSWL